MAISAPVSLRIPIARGVAPTSGRLQPLDALRGSAMLFVFLSHFANGYFGTIGEHRIEQWVTSVAYVASPTFVLVAGMLLGWMYQARAATFDRFARYLRDRAVFLLSVAHGLFMIAVVPRVWAGAQSLDEVIITDVIGVALLVGPTLVRQLRRRKRLEIALALYVVSWMVVLLTTPTSLAARVVKHTLVGPGPQEVGFWSYGVPILPWLAVYLSGTVLGEWVAIRGAKGLTRDVALRLATLGVGATMLSTTQRAAAVALRHQGGALARLVSHPVVAALSSPWQKVPPGPGYLLFFGGIGLVLAAAVFVAVDLWASSAPVRFLSLLGRASLFVFMLQFFVFYGALPLLHLPWTRAWPLLFATLVALLTLAARWWDAHGYNRLLLVRVTPHGPWRPAWVAGAVTTAMLLVSVALTQDAPAAERAARPGRALGLPAPASVTRPRAQVPPAAPRRVAIRPLRLHAE